MLVLTGLATAPLAPECRHARILGVDMPPVIALVRLTQAQFRNWLSLLEAPPYPTLEIDVVAATVLLERSDLD